MNIREHCQLSVRKFGGTIEDYTKIHSFIDSSKYFYPHYKHRILLHNTFGAYLATIKFGEYTNNGILVRDVVFEHCKEDLDGKVPTLDNWFDNIELCNDIKIPTITDENYSIINSFTNNPLALYISNSDFGRYLYNSVFGCVNDSTYNYYRIADFLDNIKFKERWQYTPQKHEIDWLYDINKKTI